MDSEADFIAFWARYPRKVGKLAAEKVYRLVRKNGATAEEISAGLEQYLTVLPTDRRWIPHARTWISQGRWMDDYDISPPSLMKEDWFEECKRVHSGACGLSQYRHHIAMQKSKASA